MPHLAAIMTPCTLKRAMGGRMSHVPTSETTSSHASRLHSAPPTRGHFVHLCGLFQLRTLQFANVLGSRLEPLRQLQGFLVGKSLLRQQSLLNSIIVYTAHNTVSQHHVQRRTVVTRLRYRAQLRYISSNRLSCMSEPRVELEPLHYLGRCRTVMLCQSHHQLVVRLLSGLARGYQTA